MSWRETLGVAEPADEPHTHNPHNAQKTAMPGNSADCADSAYMDAEEAASNLLEALSDACRDLPITPAAVRDALASEDIEDWRNGEVTSDTLAARSGCGFPARCWAAPGAGTAWTDRPIPRPHALRCQDCAHFRRTGHPHLGHCAKGEPEAIAGLWDRPPLLRRVFAALQTRRQRRISRR